MKKIISLALVFCGILAGCGGDGSMKGPEVYEIDGDTLPSFTTVVGVRKFIRENDVSSQYEDTIAYSYLYNGISNAKEDAEKYWDYLLDNHHFMKPSWHIPEEDNDGYVILSLIAGRSVTIGKELTAVIIYNEREKDVHITFTKSGRNEGEAETKTVGSDSHGYWEIPANWHGFDSIENTGTLMSWARDAITIVHLDVFTGDYTAKELTNSMASDLVDEIGYDNVAVDWEQEIDGYEAYLIIGQYPHGAVLLAWLFDDESGATHYLAAEGLGNEDGDFIFDIVSSYRLKK